jgi:hypothetical protein
VRHPSTIACLLLALAIGSGTAADAQGVDPERVAEVKAGFLVNFIRYTNWPATSFSGPDSPVRVAVIGGELVAENLERISERAGPIAGGRGIAVTAMDSLEEMSGAERDTIGETLRESHLVYVAEESARAADLVKSLAGHDVLTVGDGTGFAPAGGMIGLWRDGERIVFDANPEAIRRSRLAVSARVLKLAHIVQTGGGR